MSAYACGMSVEGNPEERRASFFRTALRDTGLTVGGQVALLLAVAAGLAVLGLALVGSERDGGNPLEAGVGLFLGAFVAGILGAVFFTLLLVAGQPAPEPTPVVLPADVTPEADAALEAMGY